MTFTPRYLLLSLFLTTLVSCQGASTPSGGSESAEQGDKEVVIESSKTPKPESSVPEDSKREVPNGGASAGQGTATPALSPGTYCYQMETDTNDAYTRIAVDASDRVTGKLQGVIHNESQDYYSSYSQKLDGTINGSNLDLDIATWIEYDKQNKQETWKVRPDELFIDDETILLKADCTEVSKVFQNEDGLEAEDLTSGAQNVKTQQVSFAPGKSGTEVSGTVVRGDRDVYTLTAQGGQQMYLSITSTEDNAVFDVVSPSGFILGTEMTQDEFFLPNTGDYEVIVGGTRGNATYDLTIDIE